MTSVSDALDLDELARPSGGLAMVAMDQRESLRAMLAEHTEGPVPDAALVRFKLAVARETGPYASGFLIDRAFGFDRVVGDRLLPAGCGLILAADALEHPPGGGPVRDTALDPAVSAAAARARGAVALKLLVIWRRDAHAGRRLDMAAEFVRGCREAGVLSVLEGVAAPGDAGDGGFDLDSALVEAATELGALRPSLYKAQVPGRGRGDPARVAAVCERVTEVLPVPWVVLSQGVAVEDFPAAVELACRSGASGFLAGRAVWSDIVGAPDPVPLLRERAVGRLRTLARIVDEHARRWREATGTPGAGTPSGQRPASR
jgi:sulfofructosephosphate aldolase